ncbi:MAG: NUDIX hydrolase [Saprospiraceae bacterium]
MKKWEILSEKDVSPSKWFPIKHHTVRLASGVEVDDYFISPMGDVAMVLPITKDNQIVLIQQYKHGLGDVIIEIPAGFQQEGKSLKASALAELEEEAGIITTEDNLIYIGKFCNCPTKIYNVAHGFLAKNVKINTTQKLEITEEIEVILKSPKEVIEMVKNGQLWVGDSVSVIMKAYLMFPELFE